MDDQFKMQNKIKNKYALKKIKFGKEYKFYPKILQSKKNWDADKLEEFIEENKLIILTLQDNVRKTEKQTRDTFVNVLDDALKRQEFAIIASKYYPIMNFIVNASITQDANEFSKAISLMKEMHQTCMEFDSKGSRKLAKMIGKRIKVAEKEYNAMLD